MEAAIAKMVAMDEESQCEKEKEEKYLEGYKACFNEILQLE